jgi:hypothetical protein
MTETPFAVRHFDPHANTLRAAITSPEWRASIRIDNRA